MTSTCRKSRKAIQPTGFSQPKLIAKRSSVSRIKPKNSATSTSSASTAKLVMTGKLIGDITIQRTDGGNITNLKPEGGGRALTTLRSCTGSPVWDASMQRVTNLCRLTEPNSRKEHVLEAVQREWRRIVNTPSVI